MGPPPMYGEEGDEEDGVGVSQLKHYPKILLWPNGEIQFGARAHLSGSVIYYLALRLHTNQAWALCIA